MQNSKAVRTSCQAYQARTELVTEHLNCPKTSQEGAMSNTSYLAPHGAKSFAEVNDLQLTPQSHRQYPIGGYFRQLSIGPRRYKLGHIYARTSRAHAAPGQLIVMPSASNTQRGHHAALYATPSTQVHSLPCHAGQPPISTLCATIPCCLKP